MEKGVMNERSVWMSKCKRSEERRIECSEKYVEEGLEDGRGNKESSEKQKQEKVRHYDYHRRAMKQHYIHRSPYCKFSQTSHNIT